MTRTSDGYAQTQQLFADALQSSTEPHPVLEHFAGSSDSHSRKLALYRGNLHAAWSNALDNAYPVLKTLVGNDFFAGLAIFYGKAMPSQAGDLTHFGERLGEFLRTFAPAADYPYFADLARLEWALHRAYYARDVVPWSIDQWMKVDSEQLLDATIQVHPACALVSSPYAITRIWQAHQGDSGIALPDDVNQPSHGLVVRERWRPTVLDMTPAAHALFDRLMAGRSLGDALDEALVIDPLFDFAGQWRTWIAMQAVTGASMRAAASAN
jgi:hypothetical protein